MSTVSPPQLSRTERGMSRRERLKASLQALGQNDELAVDLFQPDESWPQPLDAGQQQAFSETVLPTEHDDLLEPQVNLQLGDDDGFILDEPSGEQSLPTDPMLFASQSMQNFHVDQFASPLGLSTPPSVSGSDEPSTSDSSSVDVFSDYARPSRNKGPALNIPPRGEIFDSDRRGISHSAHMSAKAGPASHRTMSIASPHLRLDTRSPAIVLDGSRMLSTPTSAARTTQKQNNTGPSKPSLPAHMPPTGRHSGSGQSRRVSKRKPTPQETARRQLAIPPTPLSAGFVEPSDGDGRPQLDQDQEPVRDINKRAAPPARSRPEKRQRPHYKIEKRYRAGLSERFDALRECVTSRRRSQATQPGSGQGAHMLPSSSAIAMGGEERADRSNERMGRGGDRGRPQDRTHLNKADVLTEAVAYIEDLREENEVLLEHLKMLVIRVRAVKVAIGAA